MANTRKLSQLADYVNGTIVGEGPDFTVKRITTLDRAESDDLSFLTSPKYVAAAKHSKAGALLTSTTIEGIECQFLIVANPYLALAKLLALYYPVKGPKPGIHTSAVVSESAKLGREICVGACVSIGERCQVGDHTIIFPGAVLGNDVSIGEHCIIYPNVVVYHKVRIGNRVIIHAGSIIGSDGFGFAKEHNTYVKMPQIGSVFIDDDVEIGANCTIDRGSVGETIIHRGVKLDNLIHLAHNVILGDDTAIAAQTGISGSSVIGKRVQIGGQAGLTGHISIGDDCILTAKAGITKSIPPKSMMSGFPAFPHRKWLRVQGVLANALEMKTEISSLRKRIEQLEELLEEKTKGEGNT
ncbi:UDP-3-O-(3-hydroxymyristoyl)glucosamine N-acyltransferase [bacterium]|nr:UDP-3-O-(3-hydroxymyristoyl)glucosamine N-acyltransferase [candidate division CSSED10-310 bacterium]